MRYPEDCLQPYARHRSRQRRLAGASVAEEVAAALDATDKDVAIGGAGLASAAIQLGLIDEFRMFRKPVVVGGRTRFLPPVTEHVRLDPVETGTFGSCVIYERYRRARMSRTESRRPSLSASPDQVFATLTGSDALAVWVPLDTDDQPVEASVVWFG